MQSEEVRKKELSPLQKIRDNYEKIVLSLEPGLDSCYDGIKSLNLIDWLLGCDHCQFKAAILTFPPPYVTFSVPVELVHFILFLSN